MCALRDPDAEKDDRNGIQKKLPGGRLKRDRGSAATDEDEDDEGDAEELDELPVHSKAATKKAKVRKLLSLSLHA